MLDAGMEISVFYAANGGNAPLMGMGEALHFSDDIAAGKEPLGKRRPCKN